MKNLRTFMAILATLSMTACGGRVANPVMVSQYGDQNKSCKTLKFEMDYIQGEIQKLLPHTSKTVQNTVLGVTGWLFVVPLFFMDFKNADKVEYEAYRQRYNHLAVIAMENNCSNDITNYPSVKEIEKEQKRIKEQKNNKIKQTNK